jgi:hypothetical protein
MRIAAMALMGALLALMVPACGGAGTSDTAEATPQDVPADEAGAPDVLEVEPTDVLTDPGPDGDVPIDAETVDVPPPPGPYVVACESNDDCRVACGQGTCDGASRRCVFVPKPGQCVLPVAGEVEMVDCFAAGAPNPEAACLFCQPAVAQDRWSAASWFDDLESAADTSIAVVDASGSGVKWHRSSRRSSTGTWSLYLGTDAGDYQAGQPIDSTASISLALPSTASVAFRFDLWIETEGTPGYDRFTIDVSAPDGEHALFSSDDLGGTTDGAFSRHELDLTAWAGQSVTLRLRFETVDARINQFEGVYVDRLGVWTGCCGATSECDDLDPCTKEHCRADLSGCERTTIEGCCGAAADCDDGDVCTLDTCPVPGEGCQHQPVANCCASADDCDDGEPCTDDLCPTPGQACVHRRTCCAKSNECVDDDPCTKGLCQAGTCRYVDTCCHADDDCDDGELCTKDQCQADGSCTHAPAHLPGCCLPQIYSQAFDQDEGGFTFSGGSGNVGWHRVTDARSKSAPGALYYGDPATDSYDDGSGGGDWWDDWGYGNEGDAQGPAVQLPMGVSIQLSFALWIEAEEGYDGVTVYVDDGTEEFAVWESDYDTVENTWFTVSVDLSALAGREIRLRFHFSCDGYGFYEGAYVDDLRVTTTCGPALCDASADCPGWGDCREGACTAGVCTFDYVCCTSSDECDDADVCTTDGCQNGKCQHVRAPGCCSHDADCDDGNPCSADACPGVGEQCQHAPVDGCCLADAECADGNECSFDWCRRNVCLHAPSCCTTDADCDDGDDTCSVDRCDGGTCAYDPTWGEGCCYPVPYLESFSGVTAFTFEGGLGDVGWHVTSGLPPADDAVLYYGDPAAFSYDASWGTDGNALSPSFLLPPGSDLRLSFDMWQHTEYSSWWDYTEVYVAFGDHEALVWAKGYDSPQEEWFHVEADVSAFGGLEVRLRFHFNSDGVTSYEGVLIDNVRVTSSCAPKPCATVTLDADCPFPGSCFDSTCKAGACAYERLCCASDADCSDGDPCTDDTCSGGTCAYAANTACCATAADCDDHEECTDDTCPAAGGACAHDWQAGCCHVDGQCDDADGCTFDRCVDGACLHAYTCCEPDLVLRSLGEGGCDDGDPCTADACEPGPDGDQGEGRCGHQPTGAEGCCQPEAAVEAFEAGTPAGWSFTDRVGTLGWQVVMGGPLPEGASALYFGDPATWSYDTGAQVGETAVLEGLALFAGVPWQLSFRVDADVGDPGDAFDRLVVEVLDGSTRYLVWTKDDLPAQGAWVDATVDLSAFAGRTVALAFRFDSVDGLNNVGAGVFLDDVAVTSPCFPRLCSGPDLCRDGLAASSDLCVAGVCTWQLPE